MKKVGIGLIGAGMIGQLAHLKNFTSLPNCEVVAIAELRPELGQQAANRFGVPKVYANHHELLADPDVDAVVVVTRRQATGSIVLDALNAGKHVLSEKPMAHSYAQGQRLVDAAKQSGKLYSVGYMKRHDIGVENAKARIEKFYQSNELGSIVFLRGYCFGGDIGVSKDGFSMTSEPRPDGLELWPMAPDWLPEEIIEDYAWFLNVNIHMLNLVRYLSNCRPSVRSVDFSQPNGRSLALDFGSYSGVLEFGEVAHRDWREGVEIFFEKGTIHVTLPQPLAEGKCAEVHVSDRLPCTLTQTKQDKQSWAFRRQAETFVQDILQDRQSITSGGDALADMALAEEIWQLHVSQANLV
jgi:predicted dehydrogenase